MKNRVKIALVLALLVSAGACRKDDKAERLKALDSAYRSGVFSKEEYDAKKAAILGQGPAPAAPVPAATPAAPPSNPPVAVPQLSVLPPAPDAAPPVAAATPPKETPVKPAPAPPPSPKVPGSLPAAPPQPKAAAPVTDDSEPAPTAGCVDAEYKSGGAEVQTRFFLASSEEVRKAAALALQNLDFTIHKNTSREVEASKKKHFSAVVGAGGEKLTLRFESDRKGGQSGTRVTGETKKSFVGHVSQKSWTSAVLAQIACNLRSGRH